MSTESGQSAGGGSGAEALPQPPQKPKKMSIDRNSLLSSHRMTMQFPKRDGLDLVSSTNLDLLQKYGSSRATVSNVDSDFISMIPTRPSRKAPPLPSGPPPLPPPKPSRHKALQGEDGMDLTDESSLERETAAVKIQKWYRSLKVRSRFREIAVNAMELATSSRKELIAEYISGERNYVRNLTVLCQFFMQPLLDLVGTKRELLSEKEAMELFSNVEVILGIHKKSLLELEIRSSSATQIVVGDVFLHYAENLVEYEVYLNGYTNSIDLFLRKKDLPSIAAFLNKVSNHPISGRLSLMEHLFHPIARLNRLNTKLDELLENHISQKDSDEETFLKKAKKKFSAFMSSMKETQEKAENVHKIIKIENRIYGSPFPTLLDKKRRYIMDDMFMRRHTATQASSRHLFLFSDMLISSFYVKHPTRPLQYEKSFQFDKIALEFGGDGALPRTFVVKEEDVAISFTASDHDVCSKWVEEICENIRKVTASQGGGSGGLLIGDISSKMLGRDQSAFLRAAFWGQQKEVQRFLDRGVPVNIKDREGMTALHFAVQEGKFKVVKLLHEKGADLNSSTASGDTALHIAAMNDHVKIAAFLLDHGADPGIRNREEKLAVDVSEKKSRRILLNRDVLDFSKITDAEDVETPSHERSVVLPDVEAKLDPLEGEILVWSGEASHLTPESVQGQLSGTRGTLFLSNYRLIFASPEVLRGKQGAGESGGFMLSTPLFLIERVEKHGHKTIGKGSKQYSIHILTKTADYLIYGFERGSDNRRVLFRHLTADGNCLFAFFHSLPPTPGAQSWSVYDFISEFERQDALGGTWRVTAVNKDFKLIPTYPPYLVVPANVSDDLIRMSSRFRSKGRVPCLSWRHPDTPAVICRSAQPLVGILGSRQADDEKLIDAILKTNRSSTELIFADARPRVNAVANQARGAGYESTEKYANTKLVFLGIENIHAMRESFRRIFEVCATGGDDTHFYSSLESSRWLWHTRSILRGATFVAETVEARCCSVLVHCSDGWDRTSQITSLAMIMLDPFYRTILGFEVLIEKEWLSFGHKFHDRCGHGEVNSESDQRSPVFLQFLDCVWQLLRQFPRSFEFNGKFLITLLDHVYSCRFGNFLFNNERTRVEKNLKETTSSLWHFLNSQLPSFRHGLYSHDARHSSPILPDTRIHQLALWDDLFLRTVRSKSGYGHGGSYGIHPSDTLQDIYDEMQRELAASKVKIQKLEKRKLEY